MELDGERPLVLIDGVGVAAGCVGRLGARKEKEWRKMVKDLGFFVVGGENEVCSRLAAGLHE